ncbi:MAG: hypothetical protein MUP81_01875 [Dehalococcoidia bacterium]|nr:hypothetical protein [Dehalococcoidia bacterium]
MRQEEESRGLKDQALEDGEEVILRPGDLPPIWKPETVGETKVGELLSVKELKFGEVLRIRTAKGIEAVPQTVSMAEIDFRALVGSRLRFIFKGAVETKSGFMVKLFQISVLKEKDGEDFPL